CAVGLYRGGRGKGSRAGRRDGFFPARCARDSGGAPTDETGSLSSGCDALRDLSAANEKFSTEYGSGGDTYVCGRGTGSVGSRSQPFTRIDHRTRASLVRAASAAGVQASRLRSARELLRHGLHGLRDTPQRTNREALHRAAPAGEERSEGGGQRARAADRV